RKRRPWPWSSAGSSSPSPRSCRWNTPSSSTASLNCRWKVRSVNQMTSVITNEGQSEHKRRGLANKGDVFASFDVDDFDVPAGRDEEWRCTPLRRLKGLHDGTAGDPVAATITVEGADAEAITVETVGRDDERLGRAGKPTDRVAAQAF